MVLAVCGVAVCNIKLDIPTKDAEVVDSVLHGLLTVGWELVGGAFTQCH